MNNQPEGETRFRRYGGCGCGRCTYDDEACWWSGPATGMIACPWCGWRLGADGWAEDRAGWAEAALRWLCQEVGREEADRIGAGDSPATILGLSEECFWAALAAADKEEADEQRD